MNARMTRINRSSHIFKLLLSIIGFFTLICSFAVRSNAVANETLSIQDGLPDSVIFSIVKDNKGYMWLGTTGGLSRYNGYDFTNYQHDPADALSLSNNSISDLILTSQGEIWAATWGGGISIFNDDGELIRKLQHNDNTNKSISSNFVQSLLEDDKGNIWIGTATTGLDYYNAESGIIQNFRHSETNDNSLSDNRVWSLVADKNGDLWIGTSNGLNHYNPASNIFRVFQHNESSGNTLNSNQVRELHFLNESDLLIGTQEGMNRLNINTGQLTRIHQQTINHTQLDFSSTVNAFAFDPEFNVVWVGTDSGLMSYSPANNSLLPIPYQSVNVNFTNERIRVIHRSDSGLLWLGTRGGGVIKLNPRASLFYLLAPQMAVTAILPATDITWLGTHQGLYRTIRKTSNSLTAMTEQVLYQDKPLTNIFAIEQAPDGTVWVASRRGLFYTDQQQNLQLFADSEQTEFRSILFSGNTLWTGTSEGLRAINMVTHEYQTIYPKGSAFRAVLRKDEIMDRLYEDKNGVIWAGTKYGTLYRKQPGEQNYEFYLEVGTSSIFALHQLNNKTLLIGSNLGLHQLDLDTDILSPFESLNELMGKAVGSILQDSENNIWLATRNGLTKFDPTTGRFINLDYTDGLITTDFIPTSQAIDNEGKFYFGSQDGVVTFQPEHIQIDQTPPVIRQDVIYVNHKPVHLKKSTDGNYHLELTHTDKFLTIAYSLLDLSTAKINQFRHRLEGFEKEWVNTGNQRQVSYTNLDPGEYTFRAQGINRAGIRTSTDLTIFIHVSPPWWNTLWAKAIFVMLLFMTSWSLHRVRISGLKRKQRELEIRVAERTKELEIANNQLKEVSSVDFLTKLINRRGFIERAEVEIARTLRDDSEICIALVDIDNFKIFNDVYGHNCGDTILKFIAQHFKNNIRKQDIVARWGGEEFIVLMPNTSLEQGLIAFEKLRSSISKQTWRYQDQALSITATFGVVKYVEGESIDACVSEAGKALYQGKRSGKNRVMAANRNLTDSESLAAAEEEKPEKLRFENLSYDD